ncbi:PE domain-containing protein [Mycobacterium sp.]|uniref:PE domain-containing protein n=1 Tax=Mycobacterium sp. TaxID=1785 RepID=UPI003D6B8CB3
MVFGMVPAAVGASAAMEAGLAGESAGVAAAVGPAVMSPVPMAADVDSARFAAIAAAAGAGHVATAEQHAAMRGLYSGAQSLAMITTVATEVMRAAAAGI